MPTRTSEPVEGWIKRRARTLGFDAVGLARTDEVPDLSNHLNEFLALDHHGTMEWMKARAAERSHPVALWPGAHSMIMLAMNYGPKSDPLGLLERPERGSISVYARGADYHDVIKKRLKQLARELVGHVGGDVKVFVDTAPVMEKPLSQLAGLGWQGKHTNLVSRDLGSWFFLGAILTSLELKPDSAEVDHCGSCQACQDICPTDAFPAPYRLDARRCISYLTIEHKGPIPHEFRKAMGNRIYGCDDCLAVCPWNKFAEAANEAKFHARVELSAPLLKDLVTLSDADFRTVFRASPIKRIGRDRFVHNVLIAIGNSGDQSLIPLVQDRLDDCDLVRDAAEWALGELS